MKKHRRASSGLLAGFVVGTLSTFSLVGAGCGASVPQDGADQSSAQPAPIATFEASDLTSATLGLYSWVVYEDSEGFRVAGVDRQGGILLQVYIRQFETVIRNGAPDGNVEQGHGYEIASSNGGLLRVTLRGHVLARVDDPDVFGNFSRDVKAALALRGETTPFSCNFWKWLECSGAVLLVIADCGTVDLDCIGLAIAAAGVCGECIADALGGGGSSGPGCLYPIYDEYTGQSLGCDEYNG